MTDGGETIELAPASVLSERAQFKPSRPRDAASLLIIDRSQSEPRVLMGRRSGAHAFFPDVYVFPGGRRDSGDRSIRVQAGMANLEQQKLQAVLGKRASANRIEALGVCAIRETFEETGLLIGNPDPDSPCGLRPDLSKLRYLARAITPPRQIRRFDAQFFCLFADEALLNPEDACSSNELQDLKWLAFSALDSVQMPEITGLVLNDLYQRLKDDPSLPFGRPVAHYYMRHGRFVRDLI